MSQTRIRLDAKFFLMHLNRRKYLLSALLLTVLALPVRVSSQNDTPKLQQRPKFSNPAYPLPGVECVTFNPDALTVADIQRGPRVKSGHWLINEELLAEWKKEGFDYHVDPQAVLAIIQRYRMDESCWIEDPHYPFHFMLSGGKAPVGHMADEQCSFHKEPQDLEIKKYGRRYQIINRHKFPGTEEWLFVFDRRHSAELAIAVIRRYGFTGACSPFGGTAAFVYWISL